MKKVSIIDKERRKEMGREYAQYFGIDRDQDFADYLDIGTSMTGYNWRTQGGWQAETLFEKGQGKISGDWLLSGEGEMLIEKRNNDKSNSNDLLNEIERLQGDNSFLKNELERVTELLTISQKILLNVTSK